MSLSGQCPARPFNTPDDDHCDGTEWPRCEDCPLGPAKDGAPAPEWARKRDAEQAQRDNAGAVRQDPVAARARTLAILPYARRLGLDPRDDSDAEILMAALCQWGDTLPALGHKRTREGLALTVLSHWMIVQPDYDQREVPK